MQIKTVNIITAGLIVGTIDMFAACIHYSLSTANKNVLIIPRYIASGLFGKEAYSGGNSMVVAGLVLHYIIAFIFTIFFFWIFPKTPFFSRNRLVTGISYAILIWIIMNLIVVPNSRIGSRPFDTANAAINVVILITCIGIPLSLLAAHYYKDGKLK